MDLCILVLLCVHEVKLDSDHACPEGYVHNLCSSHVQTTYQSRKSAPSYMCDQKVQSVVPVPESQVCGMHVSKSGLSGLYYVCPNKITLTASACRVNL